MLEAIAVSVLNPDRIPEAGNAGAMLYRPIAGGSPPKKYRHSYATSASHSSQTKATVRVSNATVSKPATEISKDATQALAQACGVSILVGLACAAASYVPGLSFVAYGGGIALLAASFFGLAAAEG